MEVPMTSAKPRRIVAIPLAAVGHTTPMMHLCTLLAKHSGCSITIVCIYAGAFDIKDMIQQRGTWPPAGCDITLLDLCIKVPMEQPIFVNGNVNLAGVHSELRNNADTLEELLRGMDDDLSLITDYQYSWVIDLAHKLGIPSAVLFTGSSTWSWFEANMSSLVSQGLIPSKGKHFFGAQDTTFVSHSDPQEEVLADDDDSVVHSDPVLRRSHIPWHFWNEEMWQDFTVTYNVGIWEKATWVLVNTCQELEEKMIRTMVQKFGNKYLPVGPLFLANDQRNTVGVGDTRTSRAEALTWLDKQPDRSVLYIAFGSIATMKPGQRTEFIHGLEASKQRFLWVVRSLMFPEEGSDQLEDRLLERGMIVPWSPQVEVLAHPAVGAFLSHCGWNSTIEGVTSGQPMICWPLLFEQNLNSKMLEQDWKVGTWLRKGGSKIVTRDEIANTIRMVMEGDEGMQMRQRAMELRRRIKEGVEESNMQTFCRDLRNERNEN